MENDDGVRKDWIMNYKKLLYPCLLTGFTLLLLYLVVPDGSLFGSDTDWFSQHVGIADYFRKTFLEQKTIFPDYSVLGAGSNFYSYAYYGYLRPDILIGCLLPGVPMKYIIIAYSIAGVIASVLLSYRFLRNQKLEPFYCFLGGLLMACSACFFHAHMQLMFVNYLPFLLLALMSVDRIRKHGAMTGLVLSLFLIYLHSFYFSIACIAVCFLYLWYQGLTKSLFLRFAFSVALSVCMAGILLLPTAYVLLENKKDAGVTTLREILGFNVSLKTLLYSKYGCGATLVALYGLLLGIRRKETRTLSLLLLFCMTCNLLSYVLNGTLYVRGKILIPFLPLVLFICILSLREVMQGRLSHSPVAFLLCLVVLVLGKPDTLILMDAFVLLAFLLLTRKYPYPAICLMLVLIPSLLYIQTGRTDQFVSSQDKRQTLFSSEEIASVYQDRYARFDCLVEPLANVNYLATPWERQTAVYSSTTNTLYSRFFYDIMKNPIRINNRVALLPDANPFFLSLMGVRYLETHEDKIPYGYQVLKERADEDGSYVLAENSGVQPLAYASYRLMREEDFDQLDFPYTLDAITNNTVVEDCAKKSFQSLIQPVKLNGISLDIPSITSTQTEPGAYELQVSEETACQIPLGSSLLHQILILSFEVQSMDGKEVSISINHRKNKLSAKDAPYPNGNHTFTYILSSNTSWDCLNLVFSPGHYSIRSFQAYQMDATKLGNPDTVPLEQEEPVQKEVLTGTINLSQDGYFVTSFPYQTGYTALVDGKEHSIEIVNKAFVGFPLEKGKHQITLLFHSPWKRAGIAFSIIGFLLFGLMIIYEFRHKTSNSYLRNR